MQIHESRYIASKFSRTRIYILLARRKEKSKNTLNSVYLEKLD